MKKSILALTVSTTVLSSLFPVTTFASDSNVATTTSIQQLDSSDPTPDPNSTVGQAGLFADSTPGEVKPTSSVEGNLGTATIYYVGSKTLYWSLVPKFIGPYFVHGEITITNTKSGKVVDVIPINTGKILGGKVSEQVSVSGLPKGSYNAVFSGSFIYDPGTGTIGNPNAYFEI